jgi:hypothetical protein
MQFDDVDDDESMKLKISALFNIHPMTFHLFVLARFGKSEH